MSESGDDPPPLPPKRRTRQQQLQQNASEVDSFSLDRLSLRSKSPEDTSSLLSASAGSLDSVLNHSRDEEEIQVLMDPLEDSILSSENFLIQG